MVTPWRGRRRGWTWWGPRGRRTDSTRWCLGGGVARRGDTRGGAVGGRRTYLTRWCLGGAPRRDIAHHCEDGFVVRVRVRDGSVILVGATTLTGGALPWAEVEGAGGVAGAVVVDAEVVAARVGSLLRTPLALVAARRLVTLLALAALCRGARRLGVAKAIWAGVVAADVWGRGQGDQDVEEYAGAL